MSSIEVLGSTTTNKCHVLLDSPRFTSLCRLPVHVVRSLYKMPKLTSGHISKALVKLIDKVSDVIFSQNTTSR